MSGENLTSQPLELIVEPSQAGLRLDQYLARQFPVYSRVYLRKVINAAGVKVDGKRTKASHALRAGQQISLALPDLPREGPRPEAIPLDVLFEDESLIIVNKPPAMVVHPAKGHWAGTLTSALQYHFDALSTVGGVNRPGIVHRLDRDTSGVMVVAKTDTDHLRLAEQFQNRTIEKEYLALVVGTVDLDRDVINLPIGIHPYQREKMAVRRDHATSRPAQTFYEVIERFAGYTCVRLLPKTGRTHQIRVHLDSIGCPVLCDKQYGGRSQLTWGELTGDAEDRRVLLARQALHAVRLSLLHPRTGQPLSFVAPLPDDLSNVSGALRQYRSLPAPGTGRRASGSPRG